MDNVFDQLCLNYKLTSLEKDEIFAHIGSIYLHPEFQKRISDKFPHHDKISLGQHILEDTIVTYKIANKEKNIELDVALAIAMFHDLYTCPWQNNNSNNTKFIHKHGFRHPIEAVINAVTWFPEYFKNHHKAEKIIDGIIHHMYPLPVCSLDNIKNNDLELQNFDYLAQIDTKIINMICKSSSRRKIKGISIASSKYVEGRILARADKKVSINNFKNTSIKSKIALLTGKNKELNKK